MNILAITSLYPGLDIPKDITPVLHYFTKEWVKKGHTVHVIHAHNVFPSVIYPMLRVLKNPLQNKYGASFLMERLENRDYVWEGVFVHRRILEKSYPSARISENEINRFFDSVINYLKEINYYPDVIVNHWDEPGYRLILRFKNQLNIPIIHVAHGVSRVNKYSVTALKIVDIIGYRSKPICRGMQKTFGIENKPYFMCYSGIPRNLIPKKIKNISERLNVYTYVGTLVKRKHAECLIEALSQIKGDFKINYIGDGAMRKSLETQSKSLQIEEKVCFYGRVPRECVISTLQESKCFIMISENETFGLVYVEAMANGCITIASRGEGMDGIIENGVNGFLCKAGDSSELRRIIEKINEMTPQELVTISNNARATALELTDEKVANIYLAEISRLVHFTENNVP